jgi:ribosomal protein S5
MSVGSDVALRGDRSSLALRRACMQPASDGTGAINWRKRTRGVECAGVRNVLQNYGSRIRECYANTMLALEDARSRPNRAKARQACRRDRGLIINS